MRSNAAASSVRPEALTACDFRTGVAHGPDPCVVSGVDPLLDGSMIGASPTTRSSLPMPSLPPIARSGSPPIPAVLDAGQASLLPWDLGL